MATSEYIPEEGNPSEQVVTSPPVPIRMHSERFSASVLARLPIVFTDVLAILLAFGAALVLRAIFIDKAVRFAAIRHSIAGTRFGLFYLSCFILVYVLVARRYGLYGQLLKAAGGLHEIRMTSQACLNAGMLLCGVMYMLHDLAISRALVVMLTASAIMSLCTRRAVSRLARYRKYEKGVSTRHVLILGTNHLGCSLGRQIINESRLGYTLRGYLLTPGGPLPEGSKLDVLGTLDDIRKIARKYFIDEVVITEACTTDKIIRLLKEARELGIDVRSISGYYSDLVLKSEIEYLGTFPLISLHRRESRAISRALKHAADFVLSLVALILAAPAMLAIAIAIRIESRGPIFYASERIGIRGHIFRCFKFRTMVIDADQLRKNLDSLNERDGVLFKVSNDPRVTRIGRFLRKYSLDELPQFFNVLLGDMSLVGPRPPLATEVEKYKLEHLRRLEVLPGLTGLWQVKARQDASFEKYIALDTAYVENWSFWLDLKILIRTAQVVLRGTGV